MALNRMWAAIASTGITPNYMETLEVTGRRSGRVMSLPVVVAIVDGERFLVSMLGEDVQWVHNVRAADGRAALRSGGVEQIRLEEVPIGMRAPIIKEYLRRAPGGRPHVPVDKDAPLAAFEAVAASFPVFRIIAVESPTDASGRDRSAATFVALTFLLSVPFWVLAGVTGGRMFGVLPVSALMAVCPGLAAALLVYRHGGHARVIELLKRSFDFERIGNKVWYVPILLLMPAAMIATYVVMNGLGLPIAPQPVSIAALCVMFVVFFGSAVAEELGWSGYATQPLQARWGTLRASLVLGLIWAVWHFVPLLQMGRSAQWIAWWSVYTVASRVLIVWIYNGAGRSVFAAALYHAISNVGSVTFASCYDPRITGIIIAIAALVVLVNSPRTVSGRAGQPNNEGN